MRSKAVLIGAWVCLCVCAAWGEVAVQTTTPSISLCESVDTMGSIRFILSDAAFGNSGSPSETHYVLISLEFPFVEAIPVLRIGGLDPALITPATPIPLAVEKYSGNPVFPYTDPGIVQVIGADQYGITLLFTRNMYTSAWSLDAANTVCFTLGVETGVCPANPFGPGSANMPAGGQADTRIECVPDEQLIPNVSLVAFYSDADGNDLGSYPVVFNPASAAMGTVGQYIPESERAALIALYTSTGGDNWTDNTNWLGPEGTEGDWFGIELDGAPGCHVIGIALYDNNMVGTIPSELADLPELDYLDLADNHLSGELPFTCLGSGCLGQVSQVYLSNNELTGAIPPVDDVAYLYLNDNQLSGLLPEFIGEGHPMEMDLSGNQLSGSLDPEYFQNNPSIIFLNLGHNAFTGILPEFYYDFGSCPLQVVILNNNQLDGGIPSSWGDMGELVQLDLSHNQLSGTIPAELTFLTGIVSINLGENQLTGSMPAFASWIHPMLRDLRLNANELSGEIPSEIGTLDLRHLALGSNQLSGSIPESFTNLPLDLEYMNLSGNLLSGTIPPFDSEAKQPALRELYLNDNQFNGSIPTNLFTEFPGLQRLDLSMNRLSGDIPSVVGNAVNLRQLHLNGNTLAGGVPATLLNLIQLEPAGDAETSGLRLDYNMLSTTDSGLRTFINGRQFGGDFEATQTVAPGNLSAAALTPYSARLTWTPIRYTADSGRYRVYYQTGGGPFHLAGSTASKSAASFIVNGLTPDQEITLAARTVTDPHAQNANTLTSDLSETTMVQLPGLATIALAPASLAIQSAQEALVGDRSFTIQNTGDGAMSWTVSDDAAWLACTPASGVSAGETDTVTVAVSTSGLAPGAYNALITVTGTWTTNSPQTIPVSLTITERCVRLRFNPDQSGRVFPDTPSQAVPATALTLELDPLTFPDASADQPAIIRIQLPPGIRLSQTLATGDGATAAPLPAAGEQVWDLAVVGYAPDKGSADIGPHAVQLFRYVAGETAIDLRVTESTAGWTPDTPGGSLGITIGLGADVWPATAASNWGEAGVHGQASTLFYLDLTGYAFAAPDYPLPVDFSAFSQTDKRAIPVAFSPAGVSLMRWTGYFDDGYPRMANFGPEITDLLTIDLNRDGREDLVGISGVHRRLYWTFNQTVGVFDGLAWLDLAYEPVTVAAGDVTGDGLPELLISDPMGRLWVYATTTLPGHPASPLKAPPVKVAALPGVPSDSLLHDLDGDGRLDYLFTDAGADKLYVVFGDAFQTNAEYATGAAPVGLSVGDFDGDGHADVAVANAEDESVTVWWSDGQTLTGDQILATVGTALKDLDTDDFNRDGYADLAVASAGNQKLVVITAEPDRQFSADRQTIYFQNVPSALSADNYDGLNGPDILLGFTDSRKLAMCVTDADGRFAYAYSLDLFGDLEVDPSGSVGLAASSVLSVAGGTGHGGISDRAGVTAIQQTGVNIFHFPRSRDLSFSVVNQADQESLLNLELLDDAGRMLASTTESIESQTQFARYLDTLLGPAAQAPGRWVRGFSTRPDTYGLWLVNEGGSLHYLDGTRLADIRQATTEILFPMIRAGEGQDTTLALINTSRHPASAALQRYDTDGQFTGSHRLAIPGYGRVELSPATCFPGLSSTDYLILSSDRPLVGGALFGTATTVSALEGIRRDAAAAMSYCPHVAVGDIGGVPYRSVLTVVNTGGQPATAGAALFGDDGVQIGDTETINLPAHGKSLLDVEEMFTLTGPATGYLVIEAGADDRIVGCITFEEAATGRFSSSLPLQTRPANRYLMGHIANGLLDTTAFFTGIACLNTGTEACAITISAFDQFGILQDARVLNTAAGERQVFLLDQLMAGLTAIFGGYILLEGPPESRIVMFELFGDQPLEFLSAVSAVPLE
ncbi:MAG TPA: FG-GAP-like repeat-containing protein [Acidobacteriota bacterium]|nr:FG-GAP-like repeat-containing protein [Acidobacteriota bacterium]HQM64129.1 FG-GAP-like repeat-containing protein [Acidobacteriota bacterium]